MSHSPTVLECRQLQHRWAHQQVLDGLDLTVATGEIYALLGGNGAGKTTTLNLILGLEPLQQGQILIRGIDVATRLRDARRHVAYLPENVALYDSLSARENLEYFLSLTGDAAALERSEMALDAVSLPNGARDRRTATFSKGMRQKVAIAIAIARQVPLLLLDEPTSGLDPRAIEAFHDLLASLRERGISTLMVTHDLLGAARLADRVGFLLAGKLREEIRTDEQRDLLNLHQHYLSHHHENHHNQQL